MAEMKDYSVTAASNSTASPDGWPENMAPSGLNNSDRELAARVRRMWADGRGVNSLAGGTTTYTLTPSGTLTAYAAGDTFAVKCNATCVASPTLNINALGAKALVDNNQTALAAGALVINGIYIISYDATNDKFIVLNAADPTGISALYLPKYSAGTAVTTLAATDMLSVYDGAYKRMTVSNARLALSGFNETGFWAQMTADQTGIVTNTSTVMLFSTTNEVDPGSNFVAGTGIYTAPSTGYYIFSSRLITEDQITNDLSIGSFFTATGTATGTHGLNSYKANQTSRKSLTSNTIIKLTAGDTVKLLFFHREAGNIAIDGDASSGNGISFFTGYRFA